MNEDKQNYKRYAEGRAKKSPLLKDCIAAFLSGGAICAGAEGLKTLYSSLGMDKTDAGTMVSCTLIFLTALLTGLGIFDRIAKHAGAGTLVPITGFANAVSSCAVDAKTEGFILGVGAKIFTIAGPVIVYGISAGVVYGVIYWCAAYV
ncbi:MAG: SpoVA/SpoVAEb family sporulation membrane protein [Ruminococcaceae bacterium]|nr:SpoVA/SpoVAEb family sporulation membrane protein [Oscillospiraceae bacterium]